MCPEPNTLAAYAEGELDPAVRADLVHHLENCDACLAIAAGIGRSQEPPSREATTQTSHENALVPDNRALAGRLGRYELVSVLGAGGMGVVYLAYDPQLERRIALKVIRRGCADAPARARLVREARLMARLSHQHIVTVFDAGEADGEAYIAMELVEGTTLARWLAAEVRAPSEILARFVVAGRALQAAHDASIVHRDFKPSNVLLDARGRVVVADFGIAHFADRQDPLTQEGAVVGTPGYMSPEQYAGAGTNAQSDQYSFAVAVYRALFDDVPPSAGGAALSNDRRQRVTETVHAALARALSGDPQMRFATMTELLDALEPPKRSSRRLLLLQGAILAGALGLVAAVAAAIYARARPSATPTAVETWHGTVAPSHWVNVSARAVVGGTRPCDATQRLEDIDIDVMLDGAHVLKRATVEATLARSVWMPCDGAPFSLERQRWSATVASGSGSAFHIALQPESTSQSNPLDLDLPNGLAGVAAPATLVWHPRSADGTGVSTSSSLQRSAPESTDPALDALDRAALVARATAAGFAVDEPSSNAASNAVTVAVVRAGVARRAHRDDLAASRARIELSTAPDVDASARACIEAGGVVARDAKRVLCVESPGALHLAAENLLADAVLARPARGDKGPVGPETLDVASLTARAETANFSVDAVYADLPHLVILDVSRVRDPSIRAYIAIFARGEEKRELRVGAGALAEACLTHNRYVAGWTSTSFIACAGSAPTNRAAADAILAAIRHQRDGSAAEALP